MAKELTHGKGMDQYPSVTSGLEVVSESALSSRKDGA